MARSPPRTIDCCPPQRPVLVPITQRTRCRVAPGDRPNVCASDRGPSAAAHRRRLTRFCAPQLFAIDAGNGNGVVQEWCGRHAFQAHAIHGRSSWYPWAGFSTARIGGGADGVRHNLSHAVTSFSGSLRRRPTPRPPRSSDYRARRRRLWRGIGCECARAEPLSRIPSCMGLPLGFAAERS